MINKKWLIVVSALLLVGIMIGYYMVVKNDQPSEKLDGRICTMDYAPVCGIDGITYGNSCMAGPVVIAYVGECDNGVSNEMPVPGLSTPDMTVDDSAAGGTFPAGEVPGGLTDEELAAA